MQNRNLTAETSVSIHAPVAEVWDALVDPVRIKQYLFGTDVVSDWKVGSPIVWKGEFQGKRYEDKGVILRMERGHVLQYSHFSPRTGQPDRPENYHTVTITLSGSGDQTNVTLSQDKNASEEERQHSLNNWRTMLEGLKKVVEAA